MRKRIGVAVLGALLGAALTVGLTVAAAAGGVPRPLVPAGAHITVAGIGTCC